MKENKNYGNNLYKIATFVLLGLIVISVAFYFFVEYSNSKYTKGVLDGQENAVDIILKSIAKDGSININLPNNKSIILVPAQTVDYAKKATILQIMNTVSKDGYVSLYNNETELVLVPYQKETK